MKYKETERKLKIDVSLEIIHESIAEYFGVTKDCVFLKSRVPEIAIRRQWFHYFATLLNPKISNAYIGAYYSDRSFRKYDHSTVLHSRKTIQGYIDVSIIDKATKMDINAIIRGKLSKHETKFTGNCPEYPFKITRYYETKEPTPI